MFSPLIDHDLQVIVFQDYYNISIFSDAPVTIERTAATHQNKVSSRKSANTRCDIKTAAGKVQDTNCNPVKQLSHVRSTVVNVILTVILMLRRSLTPVLRVVNYLLLKAT